MRPLKRKASLNLLRNLEDPLKVEREIELTYWILIVLLLKTGFRSVSPIAGISIRNLPSKT